MAASGWLLVILLVSFRVKEGIAGTCSSSDNLGNSPVSSFYNGIASNSAEQYFMTDSEYVSPCCGALTSWTIYAGRTGDIIFQVWRPAGGKSAYLVGENAVNVGSTGTFTHTVATSDLIDVEQSDIIGWYSVGQDIVGYKTGGIRNDNNYQEDISAPSVGDTVTYSTQKTDLTFAIYAELDARAAPTLTNLDDSITLYSNSFDTVIPVFTVTSSSVNAVYSLASITPSSHFTVSSSTGDVTATTTSISTATYTLTISAVDTCTDSTTGTLTIDVVMTFPIWSNLDASVTVFKSGLSSVVFTAVATNPVVTGAISYSVQSISPSSDFTVDSGSGNVTATSSSVAATTFTLVIRATDKYGNYGDGTLTLTVTNQLPEITSLPAVSDVSESAIDETLLHTVNVTDADGDIVTCAMTSSPSGPFLTKFMTEDGILKTGLYLQANPGLNYTKANAYELSVTCSDVDAASDTGILYVYVTANHVPVIANLHNITSILSSTPTTTTIFNILTTDVEGDTIYFRLTCTVAVPCPFSIYSDGSVALTTSLLSTVTNVYEVDISVYDDFSSSGSHRLTIFVTDLNTTPLLSNLPATIQVTEDKPIGTVVFDASVYDEDGDTVHTFTASYNPSTSAALFQMNSSTGELTLQTSLNFLTQDNNYSITIQVSDAQTTSSVEVLHILVVDVNQAPVLYQTNYLVEVDEGSAGTSIPDPGYNVFDADSDTLTYSWGGEDDTSGFSINTTNGIVSLSIDFDVDDTSVKTFYTWLIVIADPNGLAATATLTLSILDSNDNVPFFNSSDYAAIVYSNAQLATVVLRVFSTDIDKTAENRNLEYSVSSTTAFRIDHTGTIFVSQSLVDVVDTIDSFSVRVRNPGISTFDSANIYISIIEPEDNDDYFDDPVNIVRVTLVCVFGPLLVIGLAYLTYRAYQAWMASPLTKGQVTQVAPYDTRMTPYSPSRSRASLVTRGSVVTPSDIRVVKQSWEAWKVDSWK